MGLIADILVFSAKAFLSRQLAEEFKAWTPWLVGHLIQYATERLPSDRRERFKEEWQSHVEEIPGQIGKVATAFSFVFAAWKMSSMLPSSDPVHTEMPWQALRFMFLGWILRWPVTFVTWVVGAAAILTGFLMDNESRSIFSDFFNYLFHVTVQPIVIKHPILWKVLVSIAPPFSWHGSHLPVFFWVCCWAVALAISRSSGESLLKRAATLRKL